MMKRLNGTHTYYIGSTKDWTDEEAYEAAMAEFYDEFYFEINNHKHYKKVSDIQHEVFVSRSLIPPKPNSVRRPSEYMYRLEVKVWDEHSWELKHRLRKQIDEWCLTRYTTPVLGIFARWLFKRT
tara:strand:+ start:66 stop:440 length:375 start_codon:yes stop_codon:yes gene_type:complete